MSQHCRTAAESARKSARAKDRKAEMRDPGPSILTSYDDLPDRSEYRRDPDRQAAIEAHAARVAAWRASR